MHTIHAPTHMYAYLTQTNTTLRSVGVVLDRTEITIVNLSLTVADLKAKFTQNAYQLDQVNNTTLSAQLLSRQLLTKVLGGQGGGRKGGREGGRKGGREGGSGEGIFFLYE